MTPEAVAAVFITFVACCVAAYVLLTWQAGRYEARYEPQLEALRNSAWRELRGRQRAEALVAELSGGWAGPERSALSFREEVIFGDYAEELEVDMGLEILGDEGGAA